MAKRQIKRRKTAIFNLRVVMIVFPVLIGVGGIAYVVINEMIRLQQSPRQIAPSDVPAVISKMPMEQTIWNWHKDPEGLFEFEMQGAVETVNSEEGFTSSRHINSVETSPVSFTVALIKKRPGPQMTEEQRWTRIREFLTFTVNGISSHEITQDNRRCLETYGSFKRSGNRIRRWDFSLDGLWLSMMAITPDPNVDLKSPEMDRFFNSIRFPK